MPPSPSHLVTPRVFARNLLANWVGVAADVLVAFFLTPFIVHGLGLAAYGVWSLANTLTGYLGLVDLGIRGSVGRYVNHYMARRDEQRLQEVIGTALLFLSAAACLTVFAAYGVAAHFTVLFPKTPTDLALDLRVVLPLLAVNLWLTFLASVYRSVVDALDRFEVANGINLAALAVRSVGAVVALNGGHGLQGLVWAALAGGAASAVGFLIAAKLLRPSLSVWPFSASRERLAEMWRFGIAAFVTRSASQLVYQADQIVVMVFFGPQTVGLYSLASMLIQYGQKLIEQIGTTLYPSLMKAGSLEDTPGLARAFFWYARVAFFFAVPLYVGFMVFGGEFLRLWIGGSAFQTMLPVLLLLSLAELASLFGSTGGLTLFSLGRYRLPLLAGAGEAGLNIGLSLTLVGVLGMGVEGVALATLVAAAVVRGIAYPRFTAPCIGLDLRDYLRKVGGEALALGAYGWLVFELAAQVPAGVGWGALALQAAAAGSLYLAVAGPVMLLRVGALGQAGARAN